MNQVLDWLYVGSIRDAENLEQLKGAGADAQPAAPIRLLSISNLQNVNALVPDQILTFSPQMTAIFGGNGSGESGADGQIARDMIQ